MCLRPSDALSPERRKCFELQAMQTVTSYLARNTYEVPPVTMKEISFVLAKCKNKSAPGQDGIKYTMLKNLPKGHLARLAELFTEELTKCRFPDPWKHANILPIPKMGKDKNDLENYRPISKLPCLGKVYERVLKERVMHHLETKKVFPGCQSSYRPGRSVWDNLCYLIAAIEGARLKGETTGIVFIDISRAFDTCSHVAILYESVEAKIHPIYVKIIQDYLSNRTAMAKLGNHTSTLHAVTQGVPQGGVLSPILFNLVLHQLRNRLRQQISISIFADDIVIWMSAGKTETGTLRSSLQEAVNTIATFLDQRGLTISASKTRTMTLGRSIDLSLCHVPVPRTTHHRFLGLHLDSRWSFRSQVNFHVVHFNHIGNLLRCMKARNRGMSRECALGLASSLCWSRILFTLPFFDISSITKSRLYETAYAKLAKIALGLLKSSNPYASIAETGTLPLHLSAEKRLREYMVRLMYTFPTHELHRIMRSTTGRLADIYRSAISGCTLPIPQDNVLLDGPAPWENRIAVQPTIPGIHGKRSFLPAEVRTKFREHLNRCYPNESLVVYTDGSVQGSSSAAGVYVPQMDLRMCCRLPFNGSSTLAELVGIHLALSVIPRWQCQIVVCTDSVSAIKAIWNPSHKGCNLPLTAKIYHEVNRLNTTIHFQWVPSHVGIQENEEADLLADAGHLAHSVANIVAAPRNAYASIASHIKEKHQEWLTQAPLIYRNQMLADSSKLLSIKIGNRKYLSVVHRIRVNLALTPSYLFRIQRRNHPNCLLCDEYGDISHFVLACTRFDTQRTQLLSGLVLKYQISSIELSALVSEPLVSDPSLLYRFLISTTLLWKL